MEIESRYSRRALLATGGVATTTAGCLGDLVTGGDDSSTDRSSSAVAISNSDSSTHEVRFHVVNKETDTNIVDETVSIPPEDDHAIDFTADGESPTVKVTVSNDQNSASREDGIVASGYKSFNGNIDESGYISLRIGGV